MHMHTHTELIYLLESTLYFSVRTVIWFVHLSLLAVSYSLLNQQKECGWQQL